MKPKTLLTLPLTPDATGNVIDANGEHFAMVPILGTFGDHTQEHAKLIAVAVNNIQLLKCALLPFSQLAIESCRNCNGTGKTYRGVCCDSCGGIGDVTIGFPNPHDVREAITLLAKITKEEQE